MYSVVSEFPCSACCYMFLWFIPLHCYICFHFVIILQHIYSFDLWMHIWKFQLLSSYNECCCEHAMDMSFVEIYTQFGGIHPGVVFLDHRGFIYSALVYILSQCSKAVVSIYPSALNV